MVAATVMCGCESASERPSSTDKMQVFVTILPQAYFVERVGGDHVEVGVMVGPGQSYHTYEPTARQITALEDAKLYFCVGVPFEAALTRKIASTNPHLQFVDTRQGIKLRPAVDCGYDHGDGDHDHHHHDDDGDPHIWLDPMLVKVQARTIAEALGRADPSHAAAYEHNLAAFEAELDQVHARLARRLAPFRGRSFFVFHPSFGYFGDAYGLTQVGVEEAGKEPSARRIAELVREAREARAKVIFVQPQFAMTSAEAVAREIGGRVVLLDPLAKDYLANLERMGDKIAEALDETASVPETAARVAD